MKHLILMLLAALVVHPAHGSDPDRVHYTADWYAEFTPRTALDMVRQTPGFSLAVVEQRRGLAGALGNVLVDGHRPIAKGQTLEEVLGRIPASQVLRIEMWRGAEAAADSSGHAVLLNVVRTPFSGQGFGSLGFEYGHQEEPMPNGTLVWTGRAHDVDYAIGVNSYSFARELPGTRRLLDENGEFRGSRRDESPRDYGQYRLNGEAATDLGGGRLRLTGKASYSRYHEDSLVRSYSVTGDSEGSDFNPFTQTIRDGELGGQFDRMLGDWELTSELLLTRGRFANEITSTHRDAVGDVGSVFAQQRSRDTGESILRATMARDTAGGRRLEFGLEGALNALDAELALTLDLGGGAFPIPVRNSNVRIEERRADGFVNHGWRFGDKWSLDLRLAAEVSRLEFSGDTNQVVELSFVKPALQLTRGFGAANQWRLRVHRDIGQLDFADFVSSVSLADERVEGGNPDLRPESRWSVELSTDLRLGDDLGLALSAFHRWVTDTADFVPVGPPDSLEDAPGNIGDGLIYGVQAVARVPVRVLRGASLTTDITWQHSEVLDPLTGEKRAISEFQDLLVNAGFRQDLPRISWGLNYAGKSEARSFLLREIDRRRASPSLDAFVEAPLPRGLRLRAAVVSLLGEAETRDRLTFDPDRRAAGFSSELGRRDPGRWYQLSVSGSF
jgi:outer membrane receptor protein involved in Fe transport